MNIETQRQIRTIQRELDTLRSVEKPIDLISPFLALPGLTGFWPMSSVQRSTGNAYDLSGQARTLTYNGNPTYNLYNSMAPYIDLDGTGDYLSRADETDLDVLGTETSIAASLRGLTFGGWFYRDNLVLNFPGFMSKHTTVGNQRGYTISSTATNIPYCSVSTDGINDVFSPTAAGSLPALVASTWYFLVGRFIPSTSLTMFENTSSESGTVGIPASVFNNTAPLEIGARQAGSLLDGRASLCFLCHAALPDALIKTLFQQTRAAFGV